MWLKKTWEAIKQAAGWGSPPPAPIARRKSPQDPDRWARMLRALRLAPSALLPALEREMAKGLSVAERKIQLAKERSFFDGLMMGRKIEALEALCSKLSAAAVSERVMGKLPSLRAWAIGALGEGALTRAGNPEVVAWARETGRFAKGTLREALLAEAIEGGRMEVAKRELGDAGIDRLDAEQMQSFMEAFAKRKEAGLSAGLNAQALEAFAQALGGWAELGEQAAGLSGDKLLDLISDLLEAIEEEKLMETKVFERARTNSSKRVREMIAAAVAAQAAKSNRPIALRSALDAMSSATGMSVEKASQIRAEGSRVMIGKMEIFTKTEGGISLYEAARLSGAKDAQRVLESLSSSNREIAPARMAALVEDVEKGVRSLVMRAKGDERASTKAWRETVKLWREGAMEGVSLADMQAAVARKVAASERSAPAAKQALSERQQKI